jgi:hypothetical protein
MGLGFGNNHGAVGYMLAAWLGANWLICVRSRFFKPQNPVFLVLQTSKASVLGNAFLFQFLEVIIFVIELFHGFVFVLLHFEMELVIRLGFYSYCCCNYNLCLTFGCLAAKKRKEKIESLNIIVILFFVNLEIKI